MLGLCFRKKLVFATLFLSGFSVSASDLLVLVPPLVIQDTQHPKIQAMADLIENSTSYKVEIIQHTTWLDYSRDLRKDLYDIAFSEAHIAAKMSATIGNAGTGLDHEILAKAAQNHQSVIFTRSASKAERAQNLINKVICVSPSPSLDAVSIYNLYTNPISQPLIKELRGTPENLLQQVALGKCDAGVIDKNWDLDESFKIIHKLPLITGPIISISPRQPDAVREAMRDLVANPEYQPIVTDFLSQVFGTEISAIEETSLDEIFEYRLLMDSVWGW